LEFNSFEDLFNAIFYGVNEDDIPEETFDNVPEENIDFADEIKEKSGVEINNDTLDGFKRFFDNVVYTDYKEGQLEQISAIVQELGTYFILSGLVMSSFEDDLLNYTFMRSKWNVFKKYTFVLGDLFLVDMAYGVATDDPKQQIQLGITMHSNSRVFFNAVIYFDQLNSVSPKIAFENDSSIHEYSNELLLEKMQEYFIA
jgi:hypothetical protein